MREREREFVCVCVIERKSERKIDRQTEKENINECIKSKTY